MQPFTLCVRSDASHFGPDDVQKLVIALEAQARDSLIEEVSAPEELLLGRDGRLQDGYRYAEAAYRQICMLTVRGLLQATSDLAGVDRNPAHPREEFSFELARKLFNQAVTLRFGRFAGRQKVLRDVRTRRIEGLLGPSYRPLYNAAILEQAISAAENMDHPAHFAWATLAGRLLVMRFASSDVLCSPRIGEDAAPVAFRTGLHVANSEIGSQSSFRVAIPLIRDDDGSASLGPYLGRRLKHVGHDLSRKVAAAFAAAADAAPTSEQATRWLEKLAKLEIDFGAPYSENRPARIAELAGRIRDAGVTDRLATKVVAEAAASAGMPSLDDDGVRTGYLLYSSLVEAAASLYISNRELTEQAAYQVLLGKIRLG